VWRAYGEAIDVEPLEPEAGNVWPGPQAPDPSPSDLQRNQGNENQRGFPSTDAPGATPGLPAGRQPRPCGGSTPPGSVEPGLAPLPVPDPQAPAPRSSARSLPST